MCVLFFVLLTMVVDEFQPDQFDWGDEKLRNTCPTLVKSIIKFQSFCERMGRQ